MAEIIELWAFRCPECGFGHQEIGGFHADQELFCVVCDHDTGQLVRLERWLAEETLPEDALPEDALPEAARPRTTGRR